MERKPRGKCVIINNEKFETMDNRSGTEFDAENLQKTFTWLQFDVDIFNDCTADSICKHIDEYSKMKHNDYQCFVLCILSHGSSEGVFGTDGECVSMKFIRQSFVGDECQTLHGKPKIFLIQACRGSEVDQGKFFRPDTSLSPDGSRPAPKLLAVDTDLVLAYATTPGMNFMFIFHYTFTQKPCNNWNGTISIFCFQVFDSLLSSY